MMTDTFPNRDIPRCNHLMRKKVILASCFILASFIGSSQPDMFRKSVTDSLKNKDFKFNAGLTFNFNYDGNTSLFSNTRAALLYVRSRNDFHVETRYFRDIQDGRSSLNSFYAMAFAGLNSHRFESGRIMERRIFPEPFALFNKDPNRGIMARTQLGLNAAINLRSKEMLRLKAGVGGFAEFQVWQLVQPDQLKYLDTLPERLQRLVFDTIGVSRSGTWARNNCFLNVYANFSSRIGQSFFMNGFFCVQAPMLAPYGNLPQIPDFPTVTKRYPRITAIAQISYQIWKKLGLVTAIYCQYDKGQVPVYLTNVMFSISQGLELNF